jgi:stage V sporulation protein G
MPGYICRYDDFDDDFDGVAPAGSPYETPAPASHAHDGPPLRRGPLRGHTQHARAGQSVLRGPHVAPRSDSRHSNAVPAERSEPEHFGSGL